MFSTIIENEKVSKFDALNKKIIGKEDFAVGETVTIPLEEFKQINNEVIQLKESLKTVKSSLEEKINVLEKRLEEKIENACQPNSNTKERTARLLAPIQTETQSATNVAFTAVLTKVLSLGELQEIKYDKVLLNIGNGYDPRHGHFTAPFRGIYLISATTFKHHIANALFVEMVKDGVQIVANQASTAEYNGGSHTVVLMLEKGEMVWMRHYNSKTAMDVYGTPNTPFTSFSGVLLFPI